MKFKYLLFFAICILIFVGCRSQPNKDSEKNLSDQKHVQVEKDDVIYLYSVDSAFLPYMPDTNTVFNSAESRRNYFLQTLKKYRDFRKTYNPSGKTNDEVALAKRNADIMFDDYMDLLNFKYAKEGHKNKETMALLSLYSPYSNSSDLQERVDLINSYPEEIKTGSIGKKTMAALDEYSGKKNIGLDFHIFSSVNIVDTNSKITFLEKIFIPQKKYHIIIFGASWCLPCKLEELQLKYWIQKIDTFQTGITAFSIDKSFDSWEKYIRSNHFQWPSFLLKGDMNNMMIKRLNFAGIPRNFLLNEKGVILFENTDLRKILKEIPYIRTNSNYFNSKAKE
jgi:thiol-disulfide isomerase/thioredoxin